MHSRRLHAWYLPDWLPKSYRARTIHSFASFLPVGNLQRHQGYRKIDKLFEQDQLFSRLFCVSGLLKFTIECLCLHHRFIRVCGVHLHPLLVRRVASSRRNRATDAPQEILFLGGSNRELIRYSRTVLYLLGTEVPWRLCRR